MKYPLAIVNHLCKVHGRGIGCGYDIGCSFSETVKNSALVGPVARENDLEFVVCAFHGYAHNRLCQLSHHPLYRNGYGIEDLEGMERVFSSTNGVACGIRYTSQFHWTQSLDLHFTQWDEDKYHELSTSVPCRDFYVWLIFRVKVNSFTTIICNVSRSSRNTQLKLGGCKRNWELMTLRWRLGSRLNVSFFAT